MSESSTTAWAIGLVLAAGLVLTASPWLWRATEKVERPSRNRLTALLRQAGYAQRGTASFVVACLVAAVLAFAFSYGLLRVLALSICAAVVAAALPFLAIIRRIRVQRRAARVVWPDVVDHLVSAVRSGLALPDSVMTLAHSGPLPTRVHFARFEAEYSATGNFAVCIDDLKKALADPVADRIFETLRMSREVGGSELSQVLRNLAAYLRQDAAIRSEVEARQSWVVIAARLGVAAPWVVLLLLLTRPEAAAAYDSAVGSLVIIVGLGITLVAYRLMIALGRFPDEERWFE